MTAPVRRPPRTTPVVCEFAKMRRLRVTPVLGVMVAGVVVLAVREATAPGFADALDDPAGSPWLRLLAATAFAVPLVSPILVAVLAGRQVDLEHQGNGWLLAHTAGLPPGALCRAKLLATGALLTAATVSQSVLVAGAGALLGITGRFPVGPWWAYTASAVAVNLVLLALHVLLAARVENQLAGIGVGVLGTFLAASGPGWPAWAAHLTPWTYYALALPADYRGAAPVLTAPWHLSVVALACAAAVTFLLFTRRLDTREV